MSDDLKGFFEYAEEDGSLPDGWYMFRSFNSNVGTWSESNPDVRLEISTEVIYGEQNGAYGPRMQWGVPEHKEGVNEDTGKTWVITLDRQKRDLSGQTSKIIAPLTPLVSNPYSMDETMLNELAPQLEGQEFFGRVRKNRKGYNRIVEVLPITEPPKGFEGVTGSEFSTDVF